MEGQIGQGRLFPCADYDHFRHFYAFGNTPPEDFLQSVLVTDCRDPTVLSLGCGDMRSPMFTILNNFGFEGGKRNGFSGVKFVLNDCSASILARNILFLYLCTTMPESIDNRKEWIASIWSLWYNHELQPQHKQMLELATQKLIDWSITWQSWSSCPLGNVVQFSSPATFAKVKAIWSNWKSYTNKSVPEMKSEREEFQMFHLLAMGIPPNSNREEGLKIRASEDVKINLAIHCYDTRLEETIVGEHLQYLSSGTAWAEKVLGISMPDQSTVVNPTLFEQDNIYNLHYSLTPYKGFSSNFLYTPTGLGGEILRLLPVADRHFKSQPMLANAVQQFSMMLQATANTLKCKKVSFTFHIGDSIEYCYYRLRDFSEIPILFDAIYTSNLFDYICPSKLVFSTCSLLKPTGTLFTATLKSFVPQNNEFLQAHFGFPPELFPAFLGVRCIGQDGQYSSSINHRPCPNSLLPFSHCTTFPWREVKSQLLVIDNIGESKRAVDCLSTLFSTVCLLNDPIESFLSVLQQFLKRVQPPISCPQFLNALVIAIKDNTSVQSYLVQLQTQSWLHGLHMHITVTEDNCPVCKQQPLEGYIQQFCLSVEMSQRNAEKFLLELSSPHVTITSFAAKVASSKLELTFYLPKDYCSSKNGTLTVQTTKDIELGIWGFKTIVPVTKNIFKGTMESLKASAIDYIFCPPCVTEPCVQALPLGRIVKHMDNGSSFETVISMNATCLTTLKDSKLNVQPNYDHLLLQCGSLTYTILYPFAIRPAKVSVKNRQIFITVERDGSIFYKERSTYYINPGNQLALPRFKCDIDAMRKYCYLQALYTVQGYPTCFTHLFTYFVNGKKRSLISGKPSKRYTYVYIHDLHYSPIFGSPALEVSYCFLDEKPDYLRLEIASQLQGSSEFDFNPIDDVEYTLMKEIFKYFSAITKCKISTVEPPARIFLNAREHFDHAVLFLLYPNHANPRFKKQLKFMDGVPTPVTPLLDENYILQCGKGRKDVCSFCKDSEIIITCDHCENAKYCSNECKDMHWLYHRNVCDRNRDTENKGCAEKASKPSSHVCSQCGRRRDSCKCCSKCKNAWYCNEKCQRLHFPQHKETCAAQK